MRLFEEEFDQAIQCRSYTEKLIIGVDFNGHTGRKGDGYDTIHGETLGDFQQWHH